MIQRIQTLFLLLSLACTSVLFFFPFGEVVVSNGPSVKMMILGSEFLKDGNAEYYSLLPLLIMIIIVNLISLVSIFLYKKRMLQIRLNIFNLVLQFGITGLMFYFLTNAAKNYGVDYSTGILVVLPIVAAILSLLAVRSIAKDEALVKSISRLR